MATGGKLDSASCIQLTCALSYAACMPLIYFSLCIQESVQGLDDDLVATAALAPVATFASPTAVKFVLTSMPFLSSLC